MIRRLGAWWLARTRRERFLLQILMVLAFAILAPFSAYQAAAGFRDQSRADLEAAREIKAQVASLARNEGPALTSDSTLHGAALAAAEACGLSVAHIENFRQERVRIVFAPANSELVYRWIGMMAAHGVFVSRTGIARVENSEDVRAEFELAPAP